MVGRTERCSQQFQILHWLIKDLGLLTEQLAWILQWRFNEVNSRGV